MSKNLFNTDYPQISLHDSIVDSIRTEKKKGASYLYLHFKSGEGFALKDNGQFYKYENASIKFRLTYDEVKVNVLKYIGLKITALPIYNEISLEALSRRLKSGKWKFTIISELYDGNSVYLETAIERNLSCNIRIWYSDMEYLGDKVLIKESSLDEKKTREYYKRLSSEELCQCAYCQNYRREVKMAYPDVAAYLDSLGIDIEKPFETIPLDPEDGYLEYIEAMYEVIGKSDGFIKTEFDGVEIYIENNYPGEKIEDHFVIAISPVKLKYEETGTQNLYETVKKYIDKYDYFRLLEHGAPADEYNLESRKIAGMINFESSVEEIERVITNVMSKEFKGTPSKVDINNPGSFHDIACEIRSEMKNAKT